MTHDTPSAATDPPPSEWAIVELMGHRRRAGLVQEVDRFGTKLLRIDIPVRDADLLQADGYVTEFYGGSAIYAFRPVAEDVARAAAESIADPRPVAPVRYRLDDRRDADLDGRHDWDDA